MTINKTTNRLLKERLYELFAQIGNALANSHRLELIDLLIQAPRTVQELADLTQMSVANTSQHLQCLKRTHLVISQRVGQSISYHLADPSIARLWVELRRVAQNQLPETEQVMGQYRAHRNDFEKISAKEVNDGIDQDEILLIDARPEVEFHAGHLPGAISLPVDMIPSRINELPMGKMVVTYCRGPICIDADEAGIMLAAYGYPVKRLKDGVVEWQEAGYKTEK